MSSVSAPLETRTVATLPEANVGTSTVSVLESTKVTLAATPSNVTVVAGVNPMPRITTGAEAGGVFLGTQAGSIESASIGTGAASALPAGRRRKRTRANKSAPSLTCRPRLMPPHKPSYARNPATPNPTSSYTVIPGQRQEQIGPGRTAAYEAPASRLDAARAIRDSSCGGAA